MDNKKDNEAAGGGVGSESIPRNFTTGEAKPIVTPSPTETLEQEMAAESLPGSEDENEVSADTISVNGIVRDAAGNTWTIPEEDTAELLYKSPFDIKKEPGFYYQFEHKDNVAQMMTEGFKPVTRREIGLQGFTPIGEYGVNVDSVYQIHDLVCLKMPTVLNERRLRALQKVCDAAVAQTQPSKDKSIDEGPTIATLKATVRTKDAAEAAERMRVAPMARYDQKHTVIRVKPRDETKDSVS